MAAEHLVSAGMIICSDSGRVLMVQTHNRVGLGLILPGGMVETDESAACAAEREVSEELGLSVTVGPLLAVEHRAGAGVTQSVHFVFAAAECIGEATPLKLQPEEIQSAVWLPKDEAVALHAGGGRKRLAAAFAALADGSPRYVENTR